MDRQHDTVHAICSGYVDRRLHRAGWTVAREVEIVHGRSHGWIDLLAFEPTTRTLVVIEVKTRLDDIGGLERQAAWYVRVLATLSPVSAGDPDGSWDGRWY